MAPVLLLQVLGVLFQLNLLTAQESIEIEFDKKGRVFDGIGAISGGGATSQLLPFYKETSLKEIFDFLFKEHYGASLQVLKVEIGGDAQSTEGSEASHMRDESTVNCSRGYEGWLMKRAKQVNKKLKFQGLPWAFSGWISDDQNPYTHIEKTVTYIEKWITCVKNTYGIDIEAIGVWNEKPYKAEYIKKLHDKLPNVKIVAADLSDWNLVDEMNKDQKLKDAISAVGVHYPGTKSTKEAIALNKPLWASEDYSTTNNATGAGCLARILNQNYINGKMTSTLIWNLIAAYSDKMPFPRSSLMTANEPWSGHYEVAGPVWITAHTTHFVDVGWSYLESSALLASGGSFVALVGNSDADFTMIIETMTHDHSECVRPPLAPYDVKAGSYKFKIIAQNVPKTLSRYVTQLKFGEGEESSYLEKKDDIQVNQTDSTFSIEVDVDQVITLSTKTTTLNLPKVPESKPFPLPYFDRFELPETRVPVARYLTSQNGYFEIVDDPLGGGRTILQQVTPQEPIQWTPLSGNTPITLMGYDDDWVDMAVETGAQLAAGSKTSASIIIAARVQKGGIGMKDTPGVFAVFDFLNQTYKVLEQFEKETKALAHGELKLNLNEWYGFRLSVKGPLVSVTVDGVRIDDGKIQTSVTGPGFVGLGCGGYYDARFSYIEVSKQA